MKHLAFLLVSLLLPVVEVVAWSGHVELPNGQKLEFSVELAEDSGRISIPMQGAKDVPLSDVSVTKEEIRFSIRSVGATWVMQVAEDGKSATGVLRQGGEIRATMKRLEPGETAVKEIARPQDPKPPFPYRSEDVEFENVLAKATLAGTLLLPEGDGPFPCVVFVSGSGPQDRDEALLGHRPFLVVADHLARNGIASLRYDDRGVAKSTGDFETATSDEFAEDAIAAVEFLVDRKEIDGRKIGIVGHSEGGLIAPICAADSADVAFIVMLAGTGISGAELMPIQNQLVSVAEGMAPEEAARQAKVNSEIFAMIVAKKSDEEIKEALRVALAGELAVDPTTKDLSEAVRDGRAKRMAAEQAEQILSPWFRRFLVMDPRENLKRVKCPVLAMNGEKDLQVPPKENLTEIEKALKAAGNADVTVIEFPGLNHLFQTCTTGAPSEYAKIEETFAPVALEALTKWIRKKTELE